MIGLEHKSNLRNTCLPRSCHSSYKLLGLLGVLIACIVSACSSGVPLQIKSLPSAEWTNQDPIVVELLSKSQAEQRYISLVLRHDSRMDTLELPLELSLENYRNELIWRDSIVLTLAEAPGQWQDLRVSVQEVSWQSKQAIPIPYSGIYRLEVRSLREKGTPGIVAIGLGWETFTR